MARRKENTIPKRFDDETFQNLVNTRIDDYLKKFDLLFSDHTAPKDFAEEEIETLHTKLTALHNSNQKLNTAFFEVYNIKRKNKKFTYASVIEEYCKTSSIVQQALFEFAAKIVALKRIQLLLVEKKNQTDNAIQIEYSEGSKTDFTLARKVLTMHFLMGEFLGIYSRPDKTEVARFIDSLINKSPSKNIINSTTYDKVKVLFYSPDVANEKDLVYVRKIFENLGMSSLVKKVDSVIIQNNDKKR